MMPRNILYDHLAEAYNIITSKYGEKTHFILASDSNKLNLNPILQLSFSFHQVVKVPTRLSPPATLDTIITTLSSYYHDPVTKPPLENDDFRHGAPSDHLIVFWAPISWHILDKQREYKTVNFRPIPDFGLDTFGQWLKDHCWNDLYNLKSVNEKAEAFQATLLSKVELIFPTKFFKVSIDDQPWITNDVKLLDRQRKREFFKHHKSLKWHCLNKSI